MFFLCCYTVIVKQIWQLGCFFYDPYESTKEFGKQKHHISLKRFWLDTAYEVRGFGYRLSLRTIRSQYLYNCHRPSRQTKRNLLNMSRKCWAPLVSNSAVLYSRAPFCQYSDFLLTFLSISFFSLLLCTSASDVREFAMFSSSIFVFILFFTTLLLVRITGRYLQRLSLLPPG